MHLVTTYIEIRHTVSMSKFTWVLFLMHWSRNWAMFWQCWGWWFWYYFLWLFNCFNNSVIRRISSCYTFNVVSSHLTWKHIADLSSYFVDVTPMFVFDRIVLSNFNLCRRSIFSLIIVRSLWNSHLCIRIYWLLRNVLIKYLHTACFCCNRF